MSLSEIPTALSLFGAETSLPFGWHSHSVFSTNYGTGTAPTTFTAAQSSFLIEDLFNVQSALLSSSGPARSCLYYAKHPSSCHVRARSWDSYAVGDKATDGQQETVRFSLNPRLTGKEREEAPLRKFAFKLRPIE